MSDRIPHTMCDKTSNHDAHVWRDSDGNQHYCTGVDR